MEGLSSEHVSSPAPDGGQGVGFATIVAPLDGSDAAERALPLALRIARHEGATLVLVRVVPFPEPPSGSPSHGSSRVCIADPPPEVANACAEAAAYLERTAAQCDGVDEVRRAILTGDPFTRVVSEVATWRRPLVVLTAHAAHAPSTGDRSDLARRVASLPGMHVLIVPHEDASGSPRPLPDRRRG